MQQLEIQIGLDGSLVCDWWSEEIAQLFCAICGKKNCMKFSCVVANKYCG